MAPDNSIGDDFGHVGIVDRGMWSSQFWCMRPYAIDEFMHRLGHFGQAIFYGHFVAAPGTTVGATPTPNRRFRV
jgi:hypothetical protein